MSTKVNNILHVNLYIGSKIINNLPTTPWRNGITRSTFQNWHRLPGFKPTSRTMLIYMSEISETPQTQQCRQNRQTAEQSRQFPPSALLIQ